MAFRQPKFAQPRQISLPEPQNNASVALSEAQQQHFGESQEWILFPPTAVHSSSQTELSLSAWHSRNTDLSGHSNSGSLDAAARCDQRGDDIFSVVDDTAGEDEDLDSLDEDLHAFQGPSIYQSLHNIDQGRSILPVHDGLGTFAGSSRSAQDQLWHCEQHRPRKRPHEQPRWSNVESQLNTLDDKNRSMVQSERIERIERWRLEQSKILLDEIEKETRRKSSMSNPLQSSGLAPMNEQFPNEAIGQTCSFGKQAKEAGLGTKGIQIADSEALWERITQHIIYDILGIDDALLSIIFGESLPSDSSSTEAHSSITSSPRFLDKRNHIPSSITWETCFCNRFARELGIFVWHLSEHPGAFSTPFDQANLDYAGIPISHLPLSKAEPASSSILDEASTASSASFHFSPTLQDQFLQNPNHTSDIARAALWDIEEGNLTSPAPYPTQDHEYWERTPNLRTVFHLLQHRFLTPHQSPTPHPPVGASVAATTTPASLRRAALIRQHHPLVSRIPSAARRTRNSFSAFTKRPDSSCGSASVRHGKRRSASSRHYWDSGGSGSLVTEAGGWGEG